MLKSPLLGPTSSPPTDTAATSKKFRSAIDDTVDEFLCPITQYPVFVWLRAGRGEYTDGRRVPYAGRIERKENKRRASDAGVRDAVLGTEAVRRREENASVYML